MKFGLKNNTIRIIQKVFSEFHEIDEVIIYGSRANGNYRPGSDIDISLKGTEINLDVLNQVSLKLDNLMLPYFFDISVFNNLKSPELLEHIKRVGVLFYKKEPVSSHCNDVNNQM